MAAPARLRVLVVDDHPDTTESTAILLALDGHDVVVANDGTSGIAKAEAHRPDLILLDVGMPKMNGYEVAREIQELRLLPKPYLVAVTGFAMQADIVRCAEAGFDLHMMKPVIPIFFQELGELLMVSKGVAARSREVAQEARSRIYGFDAAAIGHGKPVLGYCRNHRDRAESKILHRESAEGPR